MFSELFYTENFHQACYAEGEGDVVDISLPEGNYRAALNKTSDLLTQTCKIKLKCPLFTFVYKIKAKSMFYKGFYCR